MDWVTPFVLSGALTAGDYYSSKAAIERGGVETSVIKRQEARAALQFALLASGDIVVQKKAPKLTWPYRIATTTVIVVIIVHNHNAAR